MDFGEEIRRFARGKGSPAVLPDNPVDVAALYPLPAGADVWTACRVRLARISEYWRILGSVPAGA